MKPKSISARRLAGIFLTFASPVLTSTAHADINWDGDNPLGNLSYASNWYGNTLPGWGFGSGNLIFNYNNASATSVYYDHGAWNDINDIIFESTFNGPTTFNGNGNGLNFNQRLENRSSSTVTIGTMKLSGAKNGATQIELNPVNGNIVLSNSSTIYNDNSKPYAVYGNNGKTLTVATALGVGSTASAVSFTLAQNSIVNFTANQTFAGGLVIKAGTVVGDVNGGSLNTHFGTGSIRIGDSATGANATLNEAGFGSAIANTITVDSGAGTRNLISSSNNAGQIPQFTGGITLNNTLTLGTTSLGGMRINSVINDGAGTNGLIIDSSGTGTVRLNQTNTFDGGIAIKRGTLEQNSAAAALGTGTVTIGDSSGGNNATLLASGNGFTATNAITVASGNTGTNSIQGNSGNSFVYSGNVTLNNNLTLGALNTGNLTLSGGIASASGTKTITNSGTGTGNLTLSTGVISNAAGTLNIVQNSATSTLFLLGTNTFSGGITLKSGKISINNTTGLGSAANVVTLGDSSGAAVTLAANGSGAASNIDQPVNVTGTGSNTISGTWNNSGQINLLRGAITLNNTNLTINSTAASGWRVQAGVTGTGNLTIQANGIGSIDMRTVAINNIGTITNAGTGTGAFQQGSAISFGANITSLIQNSSTSNWNINQANGSFTGTAQALAGTMAVTSATGLGASNAVSVASGAVFDVRDISLTIAGLNDVSGSGGTVTDTTGTVVRTLTLGGSGTYSYGGAITATTLANMAIAKSGTGTQTLSGASNYSGGTTISGGILKAGNSNAFGTGAISLNNTAGTLDLNAQSIGNTLNISAAGLLINSSASTAALAADANVTSNFTVNTTGDITATRFVGTGAPRTITKNGAGTLTTNGSSHNNLTAWQINQGGVVFANTAGYGADRGVTIEGGTLRLGGTNSDLVNDGQAFTINSGSFDLNGKSEAVASIGGTGGTVTNSASSTISTLYVGGGVSGASSATFAGVIENGAGTMKLTKEGTGIQTLTGTNTYTGATSINNGTLALGATGSIDNTSGVSLGTGGTFDVTAKTGGYTVSNLSGSGNVVGSITVSTQLSIGNSPGTTTFDNLTLGGSSTYFHELTGGDITADLGLVEGNLTLGSGALLDLFQLGTYTANEKFTLFAYTGILSGGFSGLADGSTFTDAGGVWRIDYNDNSAGLNGGTLSGASYVTVTAVPEPRAALIGGIGLLALLRRRRK